jgi:hypothetical protein
MPCIGITLETIAIAATGRVMLAGLIENINTAALAPGTRCWVSSTVAGAIQFTAPVWPAIRQEVGTILVQHAVTGSAEVLTRSAFDDSVIDHAGLMNLAAGDPHPQYQKESELGIAGGYCALPSPLNPTLPLRADGLPARPDGIFHQADFLSGTSTGNPPWTGGPVGAGTISSSPGLPNHPGIAICQSVAAANTGYRFILSTPSIQLAGLESSTMIFNLQVLAGLIVRAGLHDAGTTADATDGCYCEVAQVGGTDGVLRGKTSSNSVQSYTASSYTLIVNTWYRISIALNVNASLVTFTLYSEAGAVLWSDTLNTNIPTGAGREVGDGFVAFRTGGAADIAWLDYIDVTIPRTFVR